MSPEQVFAWLQESGALQSGHFLLSSGLHSPAYVQCALLLERPERAQALGRELAERIQVFGVDSILSPALGGIVIGHECAEALGVPFRFCERTGSDLTLRRGFSLRHGERVAIIEDVVTTGKSTFETVRVAEGFGAVVVALGCILDRRRQGLEFPLPFEALARLELPSFQAEECPLCQAGQPIEKPGSRPSPEVEVQAG
jgi:orotate phosphoribosyltransferase